MHQPTTTTTTSLPRPQRLTRRILIHAARSPLGTTSLDHIATQLTRFAQITPPTSTQLRTWIRDITQFETTRDRPPLGIIISQPNDPDTPYNEIWEDNPPETLPPGDTDAWYNTCETVITYWNTDPATTRPQPQRQQTTLDDGTTIQLTQNPDGRLFIRLDDAPWTIANITLNGGTKGYTAIELVPHISRYEYHKRTPTQHTDNNHAPTPITPASPASPTTHPY